MMALGGFSAAECYARLREFVASDSERIDPRVLARIVRGAEMSGPDFTRAVRAHPQGRSVPILMVTTRGAREEIVAAVDAGVTSYIHKPFTPPALKEKIERVLAGVGAAA